MTRTFPRDMLTKAFGTFGPMLGIFAIGGPVLGEFLIDADLALWRMWVRLAAWMIADREVLTPHVGAVLSGVGVRVFGAVVTAEPDTPDASLRSREVQRSTRSCIG